MLHENHSESVLFVTSSRSSALQSRLREETPFTVHAVSPDEVLSEDVDSGSRSDGGVGTGSNAGAASESQPSLEQEHDGRQFAAVIAELECSAETSAVLDHVNATAPDLPTIVTPQTGSEGLATAALRANADEYAPADRDEQQLDRIVETIRSSPDAKPRTEQTTAAAETRPANATEPTAETHQVTEPSDGTYHRILANELPDEAFVIAADGTYLEAKVRPDSADLYSKPADELTGQRLEDAFPNDVAAELQACIDRTIRTGDIQSVEYGAETTEGRRQFEARVVPIDDRIKGQHAVVWLARDITERARRERELRSRQDELETLNRISTVLGQVIETLVEAPSRDAIEDEVCEQLVDSELYCGSWIAERTTGKGTLSFRTSAGEAETYLDRVDEFEFEHEWLVQRAVRTGEAQTETEVLESETVPEPLRAAAREDEIRSAIAVPISHNDSIYGVLGVLASRENAFSDDEQAGFTLLGEAIGFTIMAVKSRQLLFADTVVELEFRIDGGTTFTFDLSEEYGCSCSLEWAGTTSNGCTFQYVTIDGLDGETVLEEARSHHSIEKCRLIHDGDDSCTIEMRLSESGVRTLANHGATIRDVTVEDGVGTCVIEISQNADVREIAQALTVIYENTELVARREVDRSVRTATERRNLILDQLTDRQLTTLRLAYYGGFFDWPRASTGEEIAEAMDVSPPTMHQHLRKGLKSVLGEFFEAGGGME
ncbi:GAF domain-containing protein [Natronorubrum sp. JWXQ-INN-674]|uniref:GAF domain-containing protein n=1 Tax=Natronorubrum halalkaliphilum TaxID=2691917 RepID=A0A6B0VHD6_9EURY|nr:bacterio-opsin activator domain-containing protein [Natronorubrum halalkaliphilum]MXV60894.1 GAF domain-containing protein [Natronorubrum halalkaliphilum]